MPHTPASPRQAQISCTADDGFAVWLRAAGGTLAISTYQAGKVALAGWDGRQVSVLMRQFDKPMGLAAEGNKLAIACRQDVMLFGNSPVLAHEYLPDQPGRYDALYLPRSSLHVGDVNVHDLAYGDDGLWLTVTRFSCLALLSDEHNFVPVWRPTFVSELSPDDRCHLNGLAMRGSKPAFVTALGETNSSTGWRGNKASGGIVIDVNSNEVVCRALSMPHSPRWHDGRLWVLNSGCGELGIVDVASGKFETVCALPGYLRGLCLVGDYALVGMSTIREQHIFGGLPVQARHAELTCGAAVVSLQSGCVTGTLTFTSGCQELFDVLFLPRVLRPNILNLDRPEARQAISTPGVAYWLRPGAEVVS